MATHRYLTELVSPIASTDNPSQTSYESISCANGKWKYHYFQTGIGYIDQDFSTLDELLVSVLIYRGFDFIKHLQEHVIPEAIDSLELPWDDDDF